MICPKQNRFKLDRGLEHSPIDAMIDTSVRSETVIFNELIFIEFLNVRYVAFLPIKDIIT